MKKYGWQIEYPVDTLENCNDFVTFSLTIPKHPCYNGTHQGDKGDEISPQYLDVDIESRMFYWRQPL